MAISPRLDLRQQQTLVMTPQLQQAIKLLQMSNLELTDFVEAELEQNPLLEREDGESPQEGAEGAEPAADAAAGDGADNTFDDEPPEPDAVDLSAAEAMPGSDENGLDADYENEWDRDGPAASDGGMDSSASQWTGGEGGEGDAERTLAGTVSLRDHILGQINVDLDDPVDRLIALHLLELLDEAGYVPSDLATVASTLNCAVERVEATLARLQQFDPCGVFARDLAECLTLQLRDRGRLDAPMQALLAHLDLLARRDLAQLVRLCGVAPDRLAQMIGEIRTLNPKPATAFDAVETQPVTPDVIMRPRQGGGWIVELNADTLPRVLVNTRYFAVVSKRARNASEKEYIVDRFHSASWLVKALHQRAQTILKVATQIVEQQDMFFTQGVEQLRPLTLRDVATVVQVHELTVSRVTNNKYIATPRGVYELRYFFNSGLSHGDGTNLHSAEAIRFRIKTLIDAETPEDVLSDDRIVDVLRDKGIDIARRTVAKYRESMRIPSSVQRRRDKSLQLSG